MPLARISEQSALLAPGGWTSAARLVGQFEIVGLDRAGQPVTRTVQIAKVDSRSNIAFLGTSAAFGAFSMQSRLHLADGSPIDVTELVQAGCIADYRFEVFRSAGTRTAAPEAADSIWIALRQAAALHDSDTIVLRSTAANNSNCKEDVRPTWAKIIRSEECAYIILKKKPFTLAFQQHHDQVLGTIGSLCLRGAEDSGWQAERELHLVICWLADALRQSGIQTEFAYDTLQHTCFVYLSPAGVGPPPIGPGRCAFATATVADDLSLAWQDASWTPTVSGFLLSGDGPPVTKA